MAEFYRRSPGCVTSTAIDKYMYITVHQPFDERIRLKYSKTELVDCVDAIEHPIIREGLRMVGITRGIEITAVADIPARAGLGSSSSFAVGLLHALHAFGGQHVNAEQLAQEACQIEIEIMREPIGKQDQYIAAYGGLQYIRFNADDTVFVDPVICSAKVKRSLHEHLMLFHFGGSRSAGEILGKQKQAVTLHMEGLRRMAGLADALREVLVQGGDVRPIGEIMDESWRIKKSLVDTISNPAIDERYDRAKRAGALGGKLLGAGGAGFLLFFVEPPLHAAVSEALSDLRQVSFGFEPQGSKIVYVG